MAYDFQLLDWKQSVRLVSANHYEERTFVGAGSFIIAANAHNNVLSQVGFAIGLDGIADAPVALFPDALVQDKEVRYTRLDSMRWRTDWSYLMFVAADYVPDLAVVQATPAAPTFQLVPA